MLRKLLAVVVLWTGLSLCCALLVAVAVFPPGVAAGEGLVGLALECILIGAAISTFFLTLGGILAGMFAAINRILG